MQATGGFQFDSYTWRARILPIFVVLFPIGISCCLWLPNFMLIARLGVAFIGPLGLAMLLSQVGRDRGYLKQRGLWQRWDGSPTVQLLRHRNENINPVIRQRYHKKLGALRPDLKLPTNEEELLDPVQADLTYEACIQYLISRTRDHKRFHMIFKENVNYGFRRNLWGLKTYGVLLSVFGVFASATRAWLEKGTPEFQTGASIVATILTFIVLVFWTITVNENWVRIPADAYASRLLEACEDLDYA